MGNQNDYASDDSMRPDLQALVSQVGIRKGKLKLVMHEGSIQFVDVRPKYRVEFKANDGGLNEPRLEFIRLNDAKPFVRSRLERAIFKQIGRFGHVKVKVKNGVVCDWHFARRHKYAAKKNNKPDQEFTDNEGNNTRTPNCPK